MAHALKVSKPNFCIRGGMRKRKIMLPPIVDMMRMMMVLNPFS